MRQAHGGTPTDQTFNGVGRGKGEIHGQGTAGHLANHGDALGVGLGNGGHVVEDCLGVGAVVQQGRHHHRPAAALCQRL